MQIRVLRNLYVYQDLIVFGEDVTRIFHRLWHRIGSYGAARRSTDVRPPRCQGEGMKPGAHR